MSEIDYEAEYNNRARVPEHPALIEGWQRDAAAYREAAIFEADVAYGPGPRNRMDLFFPTTERRADRLIMFIHGGYWQALNNKSFSHMARGAVAHGITVAAPTYTLCPEVGIGDIVEEMRQATRALWERFHVPITVSGHSAGGHLAAALLATSWGKDGPIIQAAQPISGLFDLAPLIATNLNAALGLDAAEAVRQSPIDWPAPAGSRLHTWVGGHESDEYHRQSRELVERWQSAGVHASYFELEGANHFTVVAPLADPESSMTHDLVALTSLD